MSSSVTLSERAKLDLKKIKSDSLKVWGPELTEAYLSNIESRLNWLADNPNLGRPRDEVREGLKSFPQGRHIVFYRIGTEAIEIIGVPHQRQDVGNHFR